MQIKLNGQDYRNMLMYAAEVVLKKQDEINALNVFPVPDGDTGSNMAMTITNGSKAIVESKTESISEIANLYSKGLLMGARGNSGVILSQFFRGIAIGLEGQSEVTTEQFHAAIKQGYIKGYESVIKAVEGTILTVSREMYENKLTVELDFITYFEDLIVVATESLNNTPNLLPVLKESNVVDAGGFGLVTMFEAMCANLKGEKISVEANFELYVTNEEHPLNPEDITFGFCTEVLVNTNESFDINDVRNHLETMGDSIVAVSDGDILKIHVHTEQPAEIIVYAQTFGRMIHMKSENMRIQAEEKMAKMKNEEIEVAIVAVASSKEFGELFNEHVKVTIVEGGQTLNPSVYDLVSAIEHTNAKKVIIFPNNSNIILAANNAKMAVDGKEIHVVETKHMTQAIEALNFYNPSLDYEENIQAMEAAIEETDNIEITNAIKDTKIDGVEIKKNDFLLIQNGKIVASESKINDIANNIVKKAVVQESELVVICIGKDGKKKVAKNIVKKIEDESPFTEVVIKETQQELYPYLVYLV